MNAVRLADNIFLIYIIKLNYSGPGTDHAYQVSTLVCSGSPNPQQPPSANRRPDSPPVRSVVASWPGLSPQEPLPGGWLLFSISIQPVNQPSCNCSGDNCDWTGTFSVSHENKNGLLGGRFGRLRCLAILQQQLEGRPHQKQERPPEPCCSSSPLPSP